jgi:hypothetical protein
VDDYTQRDFFYHNHLVTPLEFDEHDAVYDDEIFLQYRPVLVITEVKVGTETWVQGTDFVVKNSADTKPNRLISLRGDWAPSRAEARVVKIKGEFGYRQTVSWPVSEAGDTGFQVSNWVLKNLGGSPVHWIITGSGGVCSVSIYSDTTQTNRLAFGNHTYTGTLVLNQDNNSGISGTVDVNYVSNDTDAANILTPLPPVVNTSVVPQGLPGHIVKATRLVAAAFSGHNRKQVAGMDGTAQEISSNTIPKTVFDMLGKRSPVFL